MTRAGKPSRKLSPRTFVRRLRDARGKETALFAALLLLALVEWRFAPNAHPAFPWHRIPGYSALIGLLAASAFIVLTWLALKPLLQRPEEDPDEKEGASG